MAATAPCTEKVRTQPAERTLIESSLAAATRHLCAIDDDWAALVTRIGPCGLRTRPQREPYEALIRSIAYQQLHARAAEAILARFLSHYPDSVFPRAENILSTEDEVLRNCGFSLSKVAAIRGIAAGALSGIVPSLELAATLPDDELVARLVTLRGVGRWTVEMFLIFSLGRPDIMPVDDFGVREGWRVMKGLPVQPRPKDVTVLGQVCSPYRSAATWYLWRTAEQAKAASSALGNARQTKLRV